MLWRRGRTNPVIASGPFSRGHGYSRCWLELVLTSGILNLKQVDDVSLAVRERVAGRPACCLRENGYPEIESFLCGVDGLCVRNDAVSPTERHLTPKPPRLFAGNTKMR